MFPTLHSFTLSSLTQRIPFQQPFFLTKLSAVSPSTDPVTWLQVHRERGAPLTEALACFDALPPVSCTDMLGVWDGEEFPTGNPMDGLMKAYSWRGKTFVDADTVLPLEFCLRGGKRFAVDPRIPLWLAPYRWLSQSWLTKILVPFVLPLLRTQAPSARLREVSCRGIPSASIVYDHLAIIDSFRLVDNDTRLGLMDRRGELQPLLFLLRRSRDTPY
jgi:hypothetical protein